MYILYSKAKSFTISKKISVAKQPKQIKQQSLQLKFHDLVSMLLTTLLEFMSSYIIQE